MRKRGWRDTRRKFWRLIGRKVCGPTLTSWWRGSGWCRFCREWWWWFRGPTVTSWWGRKFWRFIGRKVWRPTVTSWWRGSGWCRFCGYWVWWFRGPTLTSWWWRSGLCRFCWYWGCCLHNQVMYQIQWEVLPQAWDGLYLRIFLSSVAELDIPLGLVQKARYIFSSLIWISTAALEWTL